MQLLNAYLMPSFVFNTFFNSYSISGTQVRPLSLSYRCGVGSSASKEQGSVTLKLTLRTLLFSDA